MRDTIDMAREAGAKTPRSIWPPTFAMSIDFTLETLQAFEALVRADALVSPCCGDFDKCQQVCMPRAAAQEREACAEICQQQSDLQLDERVMRGIDVCKEAIRARGGRMSIITIRTWLDSGANIHSCYKTEFEIDEAEWDAMCEEEKEDYAREYAWDRMGWGWAIKENT